MKELVTRKIYYKKYNHRLAIKTRKNQNKITDPTPEIVEWLLATKFGKNWRGITSTSYEGHWSWHRGPSMKLYTVFFRDPKIFEYLESAIGRDNFLEYEKPLDEAHTEQMEREKVVTRTQLFYKKYRIAFRVPAKTIKNKQGSSTAHFKEMMAWCEDQFGSRSDNREKYCVQYYTNGTFYFADTKDAMLFKMTWSDNIGSTERVVLVSELEAARQAGEAN